MGGTSPFDPTRAYELGALRYVRAIARAGSMTAAARALKVSQPTLSVAVHELEHRLGTALFLRGPKGVVPTESGEALVRLADEVLALVRHADDEIRGLARSPRGRFVLGCYHSLGAFFLPGLMGAMAERAPSVELALWEGTSLETREAVLAREIHYGLTIWPAPHPDLVLVPLFRDLMVVVRGRRPVPPKAPLFYVPRIFSNQKVLDALKSAGRVPGRVVACGDLELVKSLVLHGVGLGILPWRVARSGTATGALRLHDPTLPYQLELGTLLYRADHHKTTASRLLHDELLAQGRRVDALHLPHPLPPLAELRSMKG